MTDKIYQALVDNNVLVPYLNAEGEEVLPLSYSSIRQNPKTGEFAFDVKPEAERYLTEEELAQAEELDWTWFCGKNIIRGHNNIVYWIANTAFGSTPVGSTTTTGQPNLEVFDTEAELETRVDEIMGEGYYAEHQNL